MDLEELDVPSEWGPDQNERLGWLDIPDGDELEEPMGDNEFDRDRGATKPLLERLLFRLVFFLEDEVGIYFL